MQEVAHDRIGIDINGEGLAEQIQPIDDPLAPVREVFTSQRIAAAQKGPADTPRIAVKKAGLARDDLEFTG